MKALDHMLKYIRNYNLIPIPDALYKKQFFNRIEKFEGRSFLD